jgi:hypothetical protein
LWDDEKSTIDELTPNQEALINVWNRLNVTTRQVAGSDW